MPNRIIKESVCSSDSLDRLSWFEEVFFYRLIVNCDDYGRMDARLPILRAKLFPLKTITDKQIDAALKSLRTAGIVYLYEVDGKPFLQLRTWEKHQAVRAKKSRY
ncbi:MAG: transcriptional regulator, partial [Butyricicoccus sp.]|nr:transcriptional regulator [Butyricicoccus sp.]